MVKAQDSIVVEHLSKHYGPIRAVDDISFNVRAGEVVGVLGPNGAGKSTTMRILCGLLRASAGRAFVNGLSVARDPEAIKPHIGYMPENNPLPEEMRVEEYLRFRAGLKGLKGKLKRTRVEEVLRLCELHRKSRRRIIGTLSKGYRQRVGIADAILAKPAVAIMDEPTIGLDPHQILIIRDLINQLRGSITILLSSHILAEVEVSCDRVLIINQGKLVASGTRDSLREEFLTHRTYGMQLHAPPAQVHRLLREVDPTINIIPPQPAREDGFYELRVQSRHPDNLAETLLNRLQQAPDVRVRHFTTIEPNLEDIFLAATRRGWDNRNNRDTRPPFPTSNGDSTDPFLHRSNGTSLHSISEAPAESLKSTSQSEKKHPADS